ncbi:MAG: hypothetical protein M1824_005952 [Vezdaea acicularis]|nr:MAG: hypothetical protein M1824_005952 [Vezdaea acicularis]
MSTQHQEITFEELLQTEALLPNNLEYSDTTQPDNVKQTDCDISLDAVTSWPDNLAAPWASADLLQSFPEFSSSLPPAPVYLDSMKDEIEKRFQMLEEQVVQLDRTCTNQAQQIKLLEEELNKFKGEFQGTQEWINGTDEWIGGIDETVHSLVNFVYEEEKVAGTCMESGKDEVKVE